MATSKSFRCNLGRLREHEAVNIQRYAARTCALSTVFRSDRGSTVLVAMKDNARTSKSFARTIRAAMRTMGVATSGLRGVWCTLLVEAEALALCSAPGVDIARPRGSGSEHVGGLEAEVKTIRLF